MGSFIDITAADGGRFKAYMTVPASGRGPGIVLLQEIFGVNAYVRERRRPLCRGRLRRAGAGPVLAAWSRASTWATRRGRWQKAFELLPELRRRPGDRGHRRARSTRCAARPECDGKVGALGFCLGGKLAYLAAARADVDCAVGYYGVGIEDDLDEAEKIKVPDGAALRRARTSSARREAREQIKAAFAGGRDVEIYVYPGADHAFARAERRALRQAGGADGAFAHRSPCSAA